MPATVQPTLSVTGNPCQQAQAIVTLSNGEQYTVVSMCIQYPKVQWRLASSDDGAARVSKRDKRISWVTSPIAVGSPMQISVRNGHGWTHESYETLPVSNINAVA